MHNFFIKLLWHFLHARVLKGNTHFCTESMSHTYQSPPLYDSITWVSMCHTFHCWYDEGHVSQVYYASQHFIFLHTGAWLKKPLCRYSFSPMSKAQKGHQVSGCALGPNGQLACFLYALHLTEFQKPDQLYFCVTLLLYCIYINITVKEI